MFEGVSVALVTPFHDGALDEEALRRLLTHLLDRGVQGIVPTGCTGEAATLTLAERRRIWEITVASCRGRAFVIAGTGTNATDSTIALTREAASLGVDGCMLICPYYNKPTQAGLLTHYQTVAEAVDIPLVLYNVPGRTGVNLLPETTAALSRHPRIVAVKEASGSIDQVSEIICNSDLTVLSGDDTLTLPMLAVGARGVVSVVGHLAGEDLVAMLAAHRAGEVEEAARIHRKLYPLTRSLFQESNPAPVKAALAHLGLIRNELRPPLLPASRQSTDAVLRAMGTD